MGRADFTMRKSTFTYRHSETYFVGRIVSEWLLCVVGKETYRCRWWNHDMTKCGTCSALVTTRFKVKFAMLNMPMEKCIDNYRIKKDTHSPSTANLNFFDSIQWSPIWCLKIKSLYRNISSNTDCMCEETNLLDINTIYKLAFLFLTFSRWYPK